MMRIRGGFRGGTSHRRLCEPLRFAGSGQHPMREVDATLTRLTSCVSRDLCDELAVNFCFLNSKVGSWRRGGGGWEGEREGEGEGGGQQWQK